MERGAEVSHRERKLDPRGVEKSLGEGKGSSFLYSLRAHWPPGLGGSGTPPPPGAILTQPTQLPLR